MQFCKLQVSFGINSHSFRTVAAIQAPDNASSAILHAQRTRRERENKKLLRTASAFELARYPRVGEQSQRNNNKHQSQSHRRDNRGDGSLGWRVDEIRNHAWWRNARGGLGRIVAWHFHGERLGESKRLAETMMDK